jgi:hypothetical protein
LRSEPLQLLVVFDHYLDDRHVQVWVAPCLLPAGLRPLSQVSALKRSPRALGVPYRGRMGKRDALARLAFWLTADVRRATPPAWRAAYRSRTCRGFPPWLRGCWRRQHPRDKRPRRSTVQPSPRPAQLAFSAAESAIRAGSYRSRLLTPLAVHRLSFNRSGHSPFFRRRTIC